MDAYAREWKHIWTIPSVKEYIIIVGDLVVKQQQQSVGTVFDRGGGFPCTSYHGFYRINGWLIIAAHMFLVEIKQPDR